MNYTDLGYDQFLTRQSPEFQEEQGYLEDYVSNTFDAIPDDQITFKKSASPDELMTIEWEKHRILISDGNYNRVILGDLDQLGVYGIRVVTSAGATSFEQSA